MKRRSLRIGIIGVLCMLASLPASAQLLNTDSLEALLAGSKADTARVRLLNLISWNLRTQDNPRMSRYAHEALALARKLNDKGAIGKALECLGVYYELEHDPAHALEHYQDSYSVYQEGGYKKEALGIAMSIVQSLREQKLYDRALALAKRSAEIAHELGDGRNEGWLLYGMYSIYDAKLQKIDAKHCLLESIRILKAAGRERNAANFELNLAHMYVEEKNTDSARIVFQRVLQVFTKQNEPYGLCNVYTSLSRLDMETQRFDEAGAHLALALKYARLTEDPVYIGNCFSVYSRLSEAQGDLAAASRFLDSSIVLFNAPNMHGGIAETRKGALQRSEQLSIKMQDWQKAWTMASQYGRLADSLDALGTAQKIEEMSARYESEKNRQAISMLEKDRALQLLELRRRAVEAVRHRQQLLLLAAEQEKKSLVLSKTEADLSREQAVSARREQDVLLLSKDKALRDSDLRSAALLRNMLLGGSVSLGLIVAVVFQRYRSRKRLSEQLAETLANLRSTQQQLIHNEKMASLGQMTAGIAHEIKNPLNFITNFADIGVELIPELRERLAAGEDCDDLLVELEQSTSKISEHGRRADSIVRSMMLHARGGATDKQRTDVNALLEDAVQLAWHGMRARFPDCTFEVAKRYDPSQPQADLVAPDITRVFLNICSNGFDALRESLSSRGPEWKPVLTVSTKAKGASIEIRIADNGPGMPERTRSKIFEPFFTTKPTGEGTGLGLSISHDIIVRGHGGSIAVESTEGKGTEFLVTLPH
jgi:two-component system, NtrC family, sensor kinase